MSTALVRSRGSGVSPGRRQKIIAEVRGKYAHVRSGSASFAARKQREIHRENKRR